MIIYVICLALCGCLAGCSGAEGGIEADQAHPSPQEETTQTSDPEDVPSCEGQIFAMDTYMSIKCYGEGCEEALEAARAEIARLEELLSVGIDTSEIAVINREGKGTVSKDTAEIIEKALEIWDTTDGAFDITIYPVMAEWGFTDGDFKVPDRDVLDGLLEHVGSGLAGVGALLLEVHILSTNLDISILCQLDSYRDVNSWYAEKHINIIIYKLCNHLIDGCRISLTVTIIILIFKCASILFC